MNELDYEQQILDFVKKFPHIPAREMTKHLLLPWSNIVTTLHKHGYEQVDISVLTKDTFWEGRSPFIVIQYHREGELDEKGKKIMRTHHINVKAAEDQLKRVIRSWWQKKSPLVG